MSTLIAEPVAAKRGNDEKPISLAEIKRLRPHVPKWEVQSITLHYCTPFDEGDEPVCSTRGGRFRDAKYLLSEFDKELRRRASRRPVDCFEFTDRDGTWVAKEKLPRGIHYETADRMYDDGLIRKPRIVPIDDPVFRRKFWHLNDVNEVLKTYDTPKLKSEKTRTVAEMKELPDDEMVNRREARLLGFKSNWLTAHADIPHPGRKREPKIVIPLGRVIQGERPATWSFSIRTSSPSPSSSRSSGAVLGLTRSTTSCTSRSWISGVRPRCLRGRNLTAIRCRSTSPVPMTLPRHRTEHQHVVRSCTC